MLFELATMGPGFDTDEDLEHLGEKLHAAAALRADARADRADPHAAAEPARDGGLVIAVLEGDRLATWTRFLKAHSAISRRLERDLADEHSLTLSDYDVLLQVSHAPEQRLRPVEIAKAVLLTRSGITRLVQGLEREGLVERVDCPDDARGFLVALTPEGARRSSPAPAPRTWRGWPSCSRTATTTTSWPSSRAAGAPAGVATRRLRAE